jgi:SAM-dependent methyltransferase
MDFAKREKYRPDYDILAEALIDIFDFDSVLDIGSANGFLLEKFHEAGKKIKGIELSIEARDYMSDVVKLNTVIGDVTEINPTIKFDLVSCVEVAEHIPEEKANELVEAINENAKNYIYFTAASPFQESRGHINCQPTFYWLNKFWKHDIYIDYRLTEILIEKLKDLKLCYWIPMNSLILKKW